MMVLFAQYYVPSNKERQIEIDKCFIKNLNNPSITKFVIFFEKESDMNRFQNSKRLIKKYHPNRLTYSDWLNETNKLKEGTLSLLINSDIYLTASVKHLIEHAEKIKLDKRFIALTRFNPIENGFKLNTNPQWCQDTWGLVKGKDYLPKALLQEAAFELGQPGCDNKIAYIMHSYGYRVTNPCEVVCTIHLQADAARNYDSKASKLLGLQIFVHPTNSVLIDSALEFDLLTRSKSDPINVRVNNWINGRKSYAMIAHTSPDCPVEFDIPDVKNVIFSEIKDENIQENGTKPEDFIFSKDFKREEYAIFVKFSDRFVVYVERDKLYFYDKYWPVVRIIEKKAFDLSVIPSSNLSLFVEGFLPTVLEVEAARISSDMQYPEDVLYWQFPCRTEGAAYDIHKNIGIRNFSEGVVNVYLPLPWATFIDKKNFPIVYINLIGSRIQAAQKILRNFNFELKIHTVCQHIRWRNLQPWLSKLGITDLWISHKEIGLDNMDKCRLHPWSLYAVNFLDEKRSAGLSSKLIAEKKIKASFIGAHMGHYPTDVRLRLNSFKDHPGYVIEIKDLWHFNKVVYNYQVQGQENEKNPNNGNDVVRYNELISNSIFSLCPAGAGPNTLRLWESLAIGSIPIVISDKFEFPFLDENENPKDFAIFCSESDLSGLDKLINKISSEKLVSMQSLGINYFKKSLNSTCF